MKSKSSNNEFDVIVIGSGMGGMTTATALSRMDHKVLLLEQSADDRRPDAYVFEGRV